MFVNTLNDTDNTPWKASSIPARTAALSDRAWNQFHCAISHHKRNHPLSPFHKGEAQQIEQQVQELTNTPITMQDNNINTTGTTILNKEVEQLEFLELLHSLSPNKSSGMDGMSNRMLQAGGTPPHDTLLLLLQTIWLIESYPKDWTKALMQPIYKGGSKPLQDPECYRGICPTCATTKRFKGILNNKLDVFTQSHNTLSPYQYCLKKGSQTHNAIYTLISTMQNNKIFD